MTTETTAPATFEAQTVVTARSACDHETVWTFTITRRTARFLTLRRHDDGTTVRVGIKTDADGNEHALPLGTFSMAPVIRPDGAVPTHVWQAGQRDARIVAARS